MIVQDPDGKWRVRLEEPRTGRVFEWDNYRTEADARAVEQRLLLVLEAEWRVREGA